MCRSTCDAYYILCELAAGLACHAFEGIAGAWWWLVGLVARFWLASDRVSRLDVIVNPQPRVTSAPALHPACSQA